MKLFLTFICRDNEKVIGEMIKSCLPIINGIIACDTGSKDSTIQVITAIAKENDLPLALHRDKWEDFGTNRTKMMRYCEVNPNKPDYLLVMDSDELLHIKQEFKKEDLRDFDCLMIETIQQSYTYPRDRIFRNNFDWEWKGRVHEYPQTKKNVRKATIKSLTLELRPKSDNKHIERNIAYLRMDEKDMPNDPRTNFYLGLSLKDGGQPKEAITYLKKRAQMPNTWIEERFYAMYQLGLIYVQLNQEKEAEDAFLEAYDMYPVRAESLYQLGRMMVRQKKRNKAIMYLEQAKEIEKPVRTAIFTEERVYDYLIDIELAALYYWVSSKFDEGYRLSKDLLTGPYPLPKEWREKVLNNLWWFDTSYIQRNQPKRFVIQLPEHYDGLGDHLMFSHLAELAHKMYPNTPIYLSKHNTYKTPGTKEYVWDNNPCIIGEADAKGTYLDINKITGLMKGMNYLRTMNTLDQIAIFYGLDPTLMWNDLNDYCKPVIHLPKKKEFYIGLVPELKDKVVFDGNWKHFSGLVQDNVDQFFENRKPFPDFQLEPFTKNPTGTHGEAKCFVAKGVPTYKIDGFDYYIGMLLAAKKVYTMMSGGSHLAVALGVPVTVLDSRNTHPNYKFEKDNTYIIIN